VELSSASTAADATVDERIRHLEERLRRTEARCNALANASGQIIWFADRDGLVHEDLPSWRAFTGQTREELPGRGWLDAIHPDDRDLVNGFSQQVAAGESTDTHTFRLRRSDGTYRIISGRYAPVCSPAGEVEEWTGFLTDVTDRPAPENVLRDRVHDLASASARITDILESITDAFFAVDFAWHFVYVNSEAERLLQKTREQLIGESVWDAFPEAVDTMFFREYHRAVSEGVPVSFVDYFEPLATWFEVHAYPSASGLAVYFLDVTDKKRAEMERAELLERERAARAATEEARTLLQAVLDVLPVGLVITDATGRFTSVNAALLEMWGKDAPQLTSVSEYAAYRAWTADTHTPLAAEEWGLARALNDGVVVVDQEVEIETFEGQRKTVINQAAPIRDATGAVVGGVAALVDITDRKQLERRTHAALKAILEMAETLVSFPEDVLEAENRTGMRAARRLAALAGQVVGCERAAIVGYDSQNNILQPIAISGLSRQEEQRWWDALHNVRPSEFADDVMARRLAAGEEVVIDLALAPPVPGQHYFGFGHTMLLPLRVNETLVGIFAVDCSEGSRTFSDADIALAHGVARLASLVVQRESLLRERAEAEARALALEETNQHMSDFLSVVSHELRTPVTVIHANIQLMRRWIERETSSMPQPAILANRQQALTRMETHMRRLMRLLEDLADLSRVQSDKLELRMERCDLLTVTRETVEGQRMAHTDRRITLRMPRRDSLPICGDPDRIGQVIANFLTNALKYSTAERPVHVRVDVEGERARVFVRDEGQGIPPEELSHIWERFRRAKGVQVQSGSGVGLGLGLYISKTIIQRHNGTVGVTSAQGEGSTFWLSLPLVEA